jgi:succinoglycan biosynthesis transport protein ExoP
MALAPDARVLLIDTDLRRPAVATRLGLAPAPGLSEYIAGLATLDDIRQRAFVGADGAELAGEGFDVISAGSPAPNPFDLLDSERTRELLREARHDYDLVVVDTVPAPLVADAVSLMRLADGVLIVAPLGKARRDSGRRLANQVRGLGAHPLGVVLNHADLSSSYYSAYEPVTT